jgi:hypothetical protein
MTEGRVDNDPVESYYGWLEHDEPSRLRSFTHR